MEPDNSTTSNSKMDNIMDFSLCLDDQSLFHINPNDLNDSESTKVTNSKNIPLRNLNNTNRNSINKGNMSFINLNDDDEDSLKDFYSSSDHYRNSSNLNTKNKDDEGQDEDDSTSNGIELDIVKHKLSNMWNNFKYGWSSYIKKPSKIELNKDEPVYILGKKFQSEHYTHPQTIQNVNNIGNSSFYYLNSNEIQTNSPVETDQPSFPLSDDLDYSIFYKPTIPDDISMTYSYLSTSPYNSISTEYVYSISATSTDTLKNNFNNFYLNKSMKTPLEQEIYSRLWFTYRKDFEPLNGNIKYTSDCGWGCMLRSAQMLIAQGLLVHHFGSEWSLYKSLKSESDLKIYNDILSLFNDRSCLKCPFGLHCLLELADRNSSNTNNNKLNTRVGTWFGPTSVCNLMKESLNEAIDINPLDNLCIYVAQDCTIFKPDLLDLCYKNEKFKPCIILIPARLGGDCVNEIYVDSLKMYLEMKNCLGIIGGKPKHSLYFFGYQGERVIYLDPHLCQPMVRVYSSEDNKKCFFDNKSFHCANAGRISFSKLDPSIAIGFYFNKLDELNEFFDTTKSNMKSEFSNSIFGISEESFEKLQLNYEVFTLEDKVIKSPKQEHKKKPSPKNKEKRPNTNKYFHKLLVSNNLNTTKLWNGTTSSTRSSSLNNVNRNRLPKKSSDQDDFVFV
ncbi:unnamed protein product [Brachionus calyciflorus]|uniref:Cysteine protease n=1 Tax=Brachionus calyciflorus TaxID=104777 RepID=A0A813T892_9BILA|nr:unnamed protein product [Brachionus calyciflorus]